MPFLGIFLTDFLQRIFILMVVLLYVFGWFSVHQLVLIYAGVVSAKGVIMFFYLLVKGELSLRPQLKFISQKTKKRNDKCGNF